MAPNSLYLIVVEHNPREIIGVRFSKMAAVRGAPKAREGEREEEPKPDVEAAVIFGVRVSSDLWLL